MIKNINVFYANIMIFILYGPYNIHIPYLYSKSDSYLSLILVGKYLKKVLKAINIRNPVLYSRNIIYIFISYKL